MDILTNKERKSYDYISRYSSVDFAYNTKDNKYMYMLAKHVSKNNSYILVPVSVDTNLDYLANKYYGRPDYFWLIADFNDILDPFLPLYGRFKEIKIPSISSIEFED